MVSSALKAYATRFNAQSPRERGLITATLLVAIGLGWWNLFAEPLRLQIDASKRENQRIDKEVDTTRALVAGIRQRIANGVNRDKDAQLARLRKDLGAVKEKLRLKTIELIDPQKMFLLMSQLIYKDSHLKLLSLKRREVKPAMPVIEGQAQQPEIYRHVLQIELSGKYLDILNYIRSIEALDWKLLWDDIEITSGDYPTMTVKIAISTLSTRREWVGV